MFARLNAHRIYEVSKYIFRGLLIWLITLKLGCWCRCCGLVDAGRFRMGRSIIGYTHRHCSSYAFPLNYGIVNHSTQNGNFFNKNSCSSDTIWYMTITFRFKFDVCYVPQNEMRETICSTLKTFLIDTWYTIDVQHSTLCGGNIYELCIVIFNIFRKTKFL